MQVVLAKNARSCACISKSVGVTHTTIATSSHRLRWPAYGYTWLIYVDAYSKYSKDIFFSATTTWRSTCNALFDVVAYFRIPEQLVMDNCPFFSSSVFAEFFNRLGIRHSSSSPYYPKSNSEAKRFVQTFKNAMEALRADNFIAQIFLSEFLLCYRVAPHATTGTSPA